MIEISKPFAVDTPLLVLMNWTFICNEFPFARQAKVPSKRWAVKQLLRTEGKDTRCLVALQLGWCGIAADPVTGRIVDKAFKAEDTISKIESLEFQIVTSGIFLMHHPL
jgi:hypothetical protein